MTTDARRAECDCGGPSMAVAGAPDHAPDCPVAVATLLAEAEARGIVKGLEMAAKKCDEFAAMMRAGAGPEDDPGYRFAQLARTFRKAVDDDGRGANQGGD